MDFGKDWDAKDTALLVAALGSVKADIDSTDDLIRRGGDETNPFLGKSLSRPALERYGMLAGLTGGGIAGLLPSEYRKPALGAWAGLEQGLARYNRGYDTKKGGGKFSDALSAAAPMAAIGGLLGHLMTGDSKFSLSASQDSKKNVNLLLGYKTEF